VKLCLVVACVLALCACTSLYQIKATVDGTVSVQGTVNDKSIPLLELSGEVGFIAQNKIPYFSYWITPKSYLTAPLNDKQREAIAKGWIVIYQGGAKLTPAEVERIPYRVPWASVAAPVPPRVFSTCDATGCNRP
jgi:hypothetical protein